MHDILLITDKTLSISDVNQNTLTALSNLVLFASYEYWIVVAVAPDNKIAAVIQLTYIETSVSSELLIRDANSSKYCIRQKVYGNWEPFISYIHLQKVLGRYKSCADNP